MPTNIWWIRRDLRLGDNPALYAARQDGAAVVPLFILDPTLLESPFVGAKRLAFLYGGLRALDEALRKRGSRLIVRKGNPATELAALLREAAGEAIYAQRDHSPFATARDTAIQSAGLPLHLTDGVAILPVGSVRKEDGDPYTVYTPYSKRWKERADLQRDQILPSPSSLMTPPNLASLEIPNAPALPEAVLFPPGEEEAKQRLGHFVKGDEALVYDYANNRDRPDLDATSRLSPYLRFGMISPRLAALGAQTAMENAAGKAQRRSAEVWLNELIWRDFYVNILEHFPHVRGANFRADYDAIQWSNDEAAFAAWQRGKTGYPFVDAAMRQLVATGWMHNRARMVVASFLVKDLLIDWRWGERFFMQELVDGDPAANNGGWQWTAGTGTDAAPYFRIFNPVSQGEKHDPDGAFVRKWVPELARVETKVIHQPWTMSRSQQSKARCRIGQDYPAPIIDHKESRERTLAAYKAAREG